MFIKNNKVYYDYHYYHGLYYSLESPPLPKGNVDIPEMHISTFSLWETFDVGIDAGTPVCNKYRITNHYPYTGELDKVVVTLTE